MKAALMISQEEKLLRAAQSTPRTFGHFRNNISRYAFGSAPEWWLPPVHKLEVGGRVCGRVLEFGFIGLRGGVTRGGAMGNLNGLTMAW
jgi:hypothetical protein